MQDIVERPSRPAGNDLGPDFLRYRIARIQETPVRTGLGFDPFKILNLIPAVLVIGAVMVQGLEGN